MKPKKKTRKPRAPRIPGKYYVGLFPLKPGWGKDSLKAATEHAESLLKENHREEFYRVVKVVRIVRRAQVPVVVEEVE